jgi:hypothetical protein
LTFVQRAAGLAERLPAASADLPTDVAARLWADHWSEVVARGDAASFARRLAWDGWSAERLGWLTAPVPPSPCWAELLVAMTRPPGAIVTPT